VLQGSTQCCHRPFELEVRPAILTRLAARGMTRPPRTAKKGSRSIVQVSGIDERNDDMFGRLTG